MEHQQIQPQRIEFTYTPQENGKELLVEVDGTPYTSNPWRRQGTGIKPAFQDPGVSVTSGGPGSGLFDAPATIHTDPTKHR